jgi:hypothetical protein
LANEKPTNLLYFQFPDDEDVKDQNENEWNGKGQRESVEGEGGLSVHVLVFWPVNVAADDGTCRMNFGPILEATSG